MHVWRAVLTTILDRDRLDGYLSADERRHAGRFHFKEDMERYSVARGLLRAILGRYAAAHPAEIVFAYGPKGKPEIEGPADARQLTFNVSHSADVALIAVGFERPLGVDVERLRDIEALDISQHFFSRQEIDLLRSLRGTERERAFFSCWTRREAILKACGEGLTGLDRAEHSVVDGRSWAVENDLPTLSGEWAVVALDPGLGYVGALAACGRDWILSCWNANLAW